MNIKKYETPPYSESLIAVCEGFSKTIDNIREGKSKEEGDKDVKEWLTNLIDNIKISSDFGSY